MPIDETELARYHDMLAAKERVEKAFLERPGVSVACIAEKLRGGRPTGRLAITFRVTRKGDFPATERIPAEIDGHPTDVTEFGDGRITRDVDNTRYTPAVGGCRIGGYVDTGVLVHATGAMVDTAGAASKHMVTAGHFCSRIGGAAVVVLQPSSLSFPLGQVGPFEEADLQLNLPRGPAPGHALQAKQVFVDAGLVALDHTRQAATPIRVLLRQRGAAPVTGAVGAAYILPALVTATCRIDGGATAVEQQGTIVSIDATVNHQGVNVHNVLEIGNNANFAMPGDSGAIVWVGDLAAGTARAVGVHSFTQTTTGNRYASPIDAVKTHFGLDVPLT